MNPAEFAQLPGGDLVIEGLRDLRDGKCSDSALLVLIASPRLSRLGIDIPELPGVALPHEHRLFERLEDRCGADAHSQYNALTRRIVSFAHALERIQSQKIRLAGG